MDQLNHTLARVSTFHDIYLYNKSVVDPYLLAAHGLVIKTHHNPNFQNNKPTYTIAKCQNESCNLTIQFDNNEHEDEIKDLLQFQVNDHDDQCPFKSVQTTQSLINYNLFNRLGLQLYKQIQSNLLEAKKYIQLSPLQVINILNIRQISQSKINLALEMFKQFDRNLHKKEVLKVQSIHFLTTFGWQFSNIHQNELICRFCGKNQNIFKFLSPSQCTLMNIPSGFEFISSHRPWCCLIRQEQPLWRQLLRQAVIDRLKNIDGKINKTALQIKCKDIQDRIVQIYSPYQHKMIGFKKILSEFKNKIEQKYELYNPQHVKIRQMFVDHANKLDSILNTTQSNIQRVIKRIKLD